MVTTGAGAHVLAMAPIPAARIAVTADVMPADVQLVLRICRAEALPDEACDVIGGFELWISVPRDCDPTRLAA